MSLAHSAVNQNQAEPAANQGAVFSVHYPDYLLAVFTGVLKLLMEAFQSALRALSLGLLFFLSSVRPGSPGSALLGCESSL